MIFAIDVGNSNIVVGAAHENEVVFVERISTNRDKTELEYADLFMTVMKLHEIHRTDICGVIISSVVPELNDIIKSAAQKLFKVEPIVVGPGVKTGLNIKIDDPAQLGSDMVVAAVAAVAEYPLPQIIFDLGTATTISVIDEKGVFRGGVISAGVRVALDSIVSHTSQLTKIGFDAPANVVGKNTIDCLKSGSIFGTAAMMDGMIDRIEKEMNFKATIIATGGLSDIIIPYCTHEIKYDDELLLKGLYLIYKKNS